MMSKNELQQQASEILVEMIQRLGLEAEVMPIENEEEEALKLNIKSDEAGRLIGRKGQNLESLELILNRIMKSKDENNPWVALEVDGYATGRRNSDKTQRRPRIDVERFESIAIDAAKEVKRQQNPKKLGPFNPAERRIIHITLQSDPEVSTESEETGEGRQSKFVLIKPAESE